jgi:hypothetical protein
MKEDEMGGACRTDGKNEKCRLDSSDSGYRPVVGSCKHHNEPVGSIKCWIFEQLSNY